MGKFVETVLLADLFFCIYTIVNFTMAVGKICKASFPVLPMHMDNFTHHPK
jgi:hypothetical protein